MNLTPLIPNSFSQTLIGTTKAAPPPLPLSQKAPPLRHRHCPSPPQALHFPSPTTRLCPSQPLAVGLPPLSTSGQCPRMHLLIRREAVQTSYCGSVSEDLEG